VGQALLCGQWQKAVRLLLTPPEGCVRSEQTEACRLYLDKGDVDGALRLIPRFLVAEPTLLQVGIG
jgi:tRNA pseudouridine13 synthase